MLPSRPTGCRRRLGEDLAESFHRLFGLACVGLRYFNVYGPNQDPAGPYAAVIPRFAQAVLAGREPLIHGDGEQSRDFVHVADAVAANLCAALAPASAAGAAYNVASGCRTSLLELLSLIEEATGRRVGHRHGPSRAGDLRHSAGSPELAAAQLGFRVSVGLADGLSASLPWYEQLSSACTSS